jgi:hypothetical protein
MANNKILLKKSSVAGKIPATGDIDFGELALNFADGRLYFRDSNDQIQFFEKVTEGTQSDLNALLSDLDCGSITDNNITNVINLENVTGTIEGTYDLGFISISGIINPDLFILPSFTVSTLPTGQVAQVVYVSNDAGGPTLAFFDGSDWRRTSDNQVISS